MASMDSPYDAAFIDDLATRFRIIEPDAKLALARFLIFAATQLTLARRQPKPRAVSDDKAERKALLQMASALLTRAAAAPATIGQRLDTRLKQTGSRSDRPAGMLAIPLTAGSETFVQAWSFADVLRALEALQWALDDPFDARTPVTLGIAETKRVVAFGRGRPRDEALHLWVINAQTFWTEALDRPFTYSTPYGEPKSEAFHFCWHSLRPLNLNVTQAMLGTAMRHVIEKRQRQKPRSNAMRRK